MKKTVLRACFMLVLLFLLSACMKEGKNLSGAENAIMLKSDDSWQSLLVEELQTKVDTEELKAFVQEEVSAFDAAGEDVKLLEVLYEEPYAKLLFAYSSFEKLAEYAAYSNDDSILFSSAEIFTIKEFAGSEYVSRLSTIPTEKDGSKVLVLKGVGLFVSEKPLHFAAVSSNADIETGEDRVRITAHEGEAHADIQTIIIIK